MTFRSAGSCRLRTSVVAALAFSTAAGAQYTGNWTVYEVLDSRIPLEIAASRQLPPGDDYFLPVLFDLATNALDMVRVDLAQNPATASPINVATGAIFALGPAVQIGNRVGSSFIDGLFDVRFGGCDAPCATTFNYSVNTGTWIDSSSAASADDFFVAALDNNTNHGITISNSTDFGGTWGIFNTLLPTDPGGVYDNFHGGKRIHLVTDPLATDPATTRNCLFYETRPAPGTTTAMHVNCRNGASQHFNVIVDTDVPNPSNQFDRLIESQCSTGPDGLGGLHIDCVYSHRQTGQVRLVQVSDSGQIVGPVPLAGVPAGGDFFSCARFNLPAPDVIHVLCPSADGAPANDFEWSAGAGTLQTPGPEMDVGPVSGEYWKVDDTIEHFLVILFPLGTGHDSPLGGGLAMSRFALPIFADSFETSNAFRWSSLIP